MEGKLSDPLTVDLRKRRAWAFEVRWSYAKCELTRYLREGSAVLLVLVSILSWSI